MISDKSASKQNTGNRQIIKDKKEKEHTPKYSQPHMIIPIEDIDWSLTQSPTVYRLWGECWKSDPYGSRYMPLTTTLQDRNLRRAKKVLRDAGLFDFKIEIRVLEGEQYYETLVINLHGARTVYWERGGTDKSESGTDKSESGTDNAGGGTDKSGVKLETIAQQAFQNPSVSPQEHLSNSSEELLRCSEIKASRESSLDSAEESLGMPLNSLQGDDTSPKSDQELLGHFEAAQGGIMPSLEVVEQLRNSRYWTGYVAIAMSNAWPVGPVGATMTPEAKQVMETLKAKKKKPWF